MHKSVTVYFKSSLFVLQIPLSFHLESVFRLNTTSVRHISSPTSVSLSGPYRILRPYNDSRSMVAHGPATYLVERVWSQSFSPSSPLIVTHSPSCVTVLLVLLFIYRRTHWKTSSVVETFCRPRWPASRDLPWRHFQRWPGRVYWPLWLSLWRTITPSLSWGTARGKCSRWIVFFFPSSLLDFYPFSIFLCKTRRRNCGIVLKLLAFCVQVHLTTDAYVYSETPAETIGDAVNRNLFFDLSQSHIYITTEKKVFLSSYCSFYNSSSVLQCV